MKEKSELIRGTSKCARFFICDTTEIVKEAKSIHNLDPVATMLFGKLLTVTAIMGKDLKGDNDLLTLKINGDGPYGNMLATGNKKGEVKGYIGTVENEKLNSIVNEKGEFIKKEEYNYKMPLEKALRIIRRIYGYKQENLTVYLSADKERWYFENIKGKKKGKMAYIDMVTKEHGEILVGTLVD